jgi:hypothetical protein
MGMRYWSFDCIAHIFMWAHLWIAADKLGMAQSWQEGCQTTSFHGPSDFLEGHANALEWAQ